MIQIPEARTRQIARRWWIDVRKVWPTLVVQSLVAGARSAGDRATVHDDLAHWDEETRGWALVALDDAGLDLVTTQVRIALVDQVDVPLDERLTIPRAPNARPNPDPVFGALDDVADAQTSTNRAEARRVVAALGAWATAQRIEDAPTAHNTPYQRGFFLDLAQHLDVAPITAQTLVRSAETLQQDLPVCWAVFLAGRVPWRAMQQLHASIAGLDPALLAEFDARAVAKLGVVRTAQLKDALHRVRERLQPERLDERHERARQGRHLRIEPAPDGMAWLTVLLPAADVLGLDYQLSKAALAAHAADDQDRTVGQLKVDVLRDGLRAFLRKPAGVDDLLVPGRRGVEAKVAVLIPAMTALGHATTPATLQGYGPIGIRTALRLAGQAKSWVRVLTDPFTGAVLNLGRRKYRPTKDMRTLIRLLDGGGRGPGCSRPPEDTEIDHTRSYRQGGEQGWTGIDNLNLLSHADHGAKTAGGASTRLLSDRTLIWRSRSGKTYVTRPHDPPEPTPVPAELLDPDDCPF